MTKIVRAVYIIISTLYKFFIFFKNILESINETNIKSMSVLESKDCSERERIKAIVSSIGSAIYLNEIKLFCPYEFIRNYCANFSMYFDIGRNLKTVLKKEIGGYKK